MNKPTSLGKRLRHEPPHSARQLRCRVSWATPNAPHIGATRLPSNEGPPRSAASLETTPRGGTEHAQSVRCILNSCQPKVRIAATQIACSAPLFAYLSESQLLAISSDCAQARAIGT